MAFGAAFRANSHDDWLRFPVQSFANAIILPD
jgi:hypothetical protein